MIELLLFLATFSVAESPSHQQILKNMPTIDKTYAKAVYNVTEYYCKIHKIPVPIMLAIYMKESGYALTKISPDKQDYGIGQINLWNIRKHKLDKSRILYDLDYSIKWSTFIFAWFLKKFPLEEAIKRYNCGFQKQGGTDCVNWDVVNKYYNDVMSYL